MRLIARRAGLAIFLAGLIAAPGFMAFNQVREARHIVMETPPAPATIDLAALYKRIGFHLPTVRNGQSQVPRRLIANMPKELPRIETARDRKRVFVSVMLPHVLTENQRLRMVRERLKEVLGRLEAGATLSPEEEKWLATLEARYKVEPADRELLLRRVDVIPPSLVIAQAAIESGWGTSRFAQQGNAIFGQWTWGGDGMAPLRREEGATHKVKSFKDLLNAVRGYYRNLNTHSAYLEFRLLRAAMRETDERLDSLALAETLHQYSERRQAYVEDIKLVIRANKLRELDRAELEADDAASTIASSAL